MSPIARPVALQLPHATARLGSGIDEELRSWALLKHDDVYGVLRDHETFSSTGNPLVGKVFPPLVLILDDPPRHTRFRRLVNKTFTLKRIDALTPWITGSLAEFYPS